MALCLRSRLGRIFGETFVSCTAKREGPKYGKINPLCQCLLRNMCFIAFGGKEGGYFLMFKESNKRALKKERRGRVSVVERREDRSRMITF